MFVLSWLPSLLSYGSLLSPLLHLFELALLLAFCFAAYSFAFSFPSHCLQRDIILTLACPRVAFLDGVLLLDLLACPHIAYLGGVLLLSF